MKYIDYIKLKSQRKIQFNYNIEKCTNVAIQIIDDESIRKSLIKINKMRQRQKVIYIVNGLLLLTPLRFLALTAPLYAAIMWVGEGHIKRTLVDKMTKDESVYDLVTQEKAIIVSEK